MLNTRMLALAVAACLLGSPAVAQEQPDEEAIHDELRAVRKGMVEAYNANDIDKLLSYCGPEIVVTWQNGEVTVGHDGIRKYYERMMVGPDRIVESLRVDPTVDDLSTIYEGTTAIARGAMNDHYELTNGMSFDLGSRWSATAVKQDDQWKIVNFHASANAFDNGILTLVTRQTMLWAAGVGVVVGLVVGAVGMRAVSRRPSTPA